MRSADYKFKMENDTYEISRAGLKPNAMSACGVKSKCVLDCDQRPEVEKSSSYFHTLFSDVDPINISYVMPQKEFNCIQFHAGEVGSLKMRFMVQ